MKVPIFVFRSLAPGSCVMVVKLSCQGEYCQVSMETEQPDENFDPHVLLTQLPSPQPYL